MKALQASSGLIGLIALIVGVVALAVGLVAVTQDDGDDKPAASKDNPDAYTVRLVDEAIAYYEEHGRDGAVAYYSDPANVDGQWYIVIADEDDAIIAHFNESIVGESLHGPIGTDATGYEFGPELAAADANGRWVAYVFHNPGTGENGLKHSWADRHDGLLFISGWYEFASVLGPQNDGDAGKDDPADYAQRLVGEALARLDAQGIEDTLAHYNSPESADGPWYVFFLEDRDGVIYSVANTARPDLVGTTRVRIDANGYNYDEALAAITEEGGGEWVSYLFTHPETRKDAAKHSWVVRQGDLLIGSGYYTDPPTKDDPEGYAQRLVGEALRRLDERGVDDTLAHYNNPESADGPWYVFFIEDRDGVLYSVAHPTRPDLVGTTWERIDANGYHYGEAFAAVEEERGGAWVSYLFTHPETGEDAPKHTWIVRRGDLLVGSGWYEGI